MRRLNNISRKQLEEIIKNGYSENGINYKFFSGGYSENYYKKGKSGLNSKNSRYADIEETKWK